MIKRTLKLLLLCFISFFLCSDSDDSKGNHSGSILYCSFENESDLDGWKYLFSENIYDEACPSGGKKSLRVAGGCCIPHGIYVLEAPKNPVKIKIEFYAKNLENGGYVEVKLGESEKTIACLTVEKKDWSRYSSREILWPADEKLTIWLVSGSYVPSSMLIDEFKVAVSY